MTKVVEVTKVGATHNACLPPEEEVMIIKESVVDQLGQKITRRFTRLTIPYDKFCFTLDPKKLLGTNKKHLVPSTRSPVWIDNRLEWALVGLAKSSSARDHLVREIPFPRNIGLLLVKI